jgi:cell division protein FtsQ
MKRPEGFDPSQKAKAPSANPPDQPRNRREPNSTQPAEISRATRSRGARAQEGLGKASSAAKRPTVDVVSPREERRKVRQAARDRRAVERGEVKRFTRRARTRRLVGLTATGLVVLLSGLLAVAVFSPILSLREITVEGANRVDAAEVRAAVDGQIGTPLALLDVARIESELAEFPLIRSYVTRTIPPSTLVIQLVEREPLGAVATAVGFDVVDAAGIVLESSPTRPDGVPVILLDSSEIDSSAFSGVSKVLLSLPSSLLANVDSIGATTRDDVTFTLRGVGQSVVWGSADSSAFKTRVLTAMLGETESNVKYEFDVSAPESVVVTRK